MELSLVFNELSLEFPAPSVDDARKRMAQFCETLRGAKELGLRKLLTTRPIGGELLADEYPLAKWFNDRAVPDVQRKLILSKLTNYPHISPTRRWQIRLDGDEQGKIAEGLGAAWETNAPATGLLSLEFSTAKVQIYCADDDLPDEDAEVRYISSVDHFDAEFREWLDAVRKDALRDGTSIVEGFASNWPHLLLCDGAEKQLHQLARGTSKLSRIIQRLDDLETFANSWSKNGFDIAQLQNASRESSSTLEQYRAARTFVCPDGKKRVFFHHLKGLPDSWRIHFWPDIKRELDAAADGKRKILIGYVGAHLPTPSE